MRESEVEVKEMDSVMEVPSAAKTNGDGSAAPNHIASGAPSGIQNCDNPSELAGFKVPRFSSKNPPPVPKPKPSPEPLSNEEGMAEMVRLNALMESSRRQKPKKKEIIWPPPPRVFNDVSKIETICSSVEDERENRHMEGAEVPATSESGAALGTATEGKSVACDLVSSERVDGNREIPMATDLATFSETVTTERHDGSGENSIATSLTPASRGAVGPGAEMDISAEGKSAAADLVSFQRLDGNREIPMATDLASARGPATGQPGAEVGTTPEGKSAVTDRAGSGGPQYVKPSWSATPSHPYTLEVLKEGVSLGIVDVSQKGAYMFGRSDRCDFVLEHPTVSRYHAVLQYNAKGKAFIYDMASTHGTFINKRQVTGKAYEPLNVGDIIRFGHSTRLHHFQGPTEFMPEEGWSKVERRAVRLLEAAQERAEREQSILRAKRNVAAADGATWGMQEDAEEEEEEEDTEEITWQTFKGELTEKQQKTLEKVHKRNEKLANLKKENDAIQAKEISQGGLTQGQQTQIARNEQRMAQLVEELENMEETLNESIREAISGRSGTSRGGKKSSFQNEDDDDDLSDDEFYDRASKMNPRKKREASQIVETAETLLEKKSSLSKEIESVRLLMKAEEEQDKQKELVKMEVQSDDPLDQFMTNISTAIVQDRTARLQKELDTLTKESERVVRLLKIADPTGDALRKWEVKQNPESLTATADLAHKIDRRIFPRKDDAKDLASSIDREKDSAEDSAAQEGTSDTKDDGASEKTLDLRPLDPPIRLGAPVTQEESEEKPVEVHDRDSEGAAGFITYKDRKKDRDDSSKDKSTLETVVKGAAPAASAKREGEANGVYTDVATSVALLLKHKRGLAEGGTETDETTETVKQSSQQPKKKKKTYGPSKPSYMTNAEEEESWVPPAGQTGDGRTSLNDKYGY